MPFGFLRTFNDTEECPEENHVKSHNKSVYEE